MARDDSGWEGSGVATRNHLRSGEKRVRTWRAAGHDEAMRRLAGLIMVVALAVACETGNEVAGTQAPAASPSLSAASSTPEPSPSPEPSASPSSTATSAIEASPAETVALGPTRQLATVSPTASATIGPGVACTLAQVVEVVDGDTLHVSIDGSPDTVRLIGVDAPEIHHPTKGREPLGDEAAAYMSGLIGAGTVCLERDLTERDDFGRLLRYVWLPDGRLADEAMLRAGLAQIVTYPPDVKYVESRFLPAQQDAREAGRGIWAGQPTPAGGCDPSYPGVCIPPPPPDLNCGDVPYGRFTVLPPDPHHFDGDGNGVGCE